MIHLDVDIRVVITVPRGRDTVRPQALEVGGQTARAGTADEQIATVIVIKRRQSGRLMVCEADDALVSRQ